MDNSRRVHTPGAQEPCVECKLSLVCTTSHNKEPFGPAGVHLHCMRHTKVWTWGTNPDAIGQPGDTLNVQEFHPYTEEVMGVSCICEFEECPFLHEMPVDEHGLVSALRAGD
jgi:hypothetical protein